MGFVGLVALTLLCHPSPSLAALVNPQVATITQIEGEANLFLNPSKAPPSTAQSPLHLPRALFEGEYYEVKSAHAGDSVENGNILRTLPNARARVIYPNGDQINVGPGSAYRIFWNATEKKSVPADQIVAQTQINLMYGKIRGIIEKGGPRSKLQVKTRAAIMGVRGTDFFIEDNPTNGETQISIIRGTVEVKSQDKEATSVAVNAGFSAHLEESSLTPGKVNPTVELEKTSQTEYVQIQKATSLEQANSPPLQNETSQEKIALLEKQATKTTLKDIERSDPKLFASLQKQNQGMTNLSPNDLNRAAMQTLFKEAPIRPEKAKPGRSELEQVEKGAYEKYFKIEG